MQGHKTVVKTPSLLSQEKKEKLGPKKEEKLYLYPWHFFPTHRTKGDNGIWSLDVAKTAEGESPKYYNLEGRVYNFPPPRESP